MSHLRDLQRLRNTRHNFQFKKHQNQGNELRLIELKHTRPLNPEPEDPYAKYLQSKEILTARESREKQIPRTGDKIKVHRRGGSFGVGSTNYDNKSKDLPQSGLSVYNFSLKLGSTQGSGTSPTTSRKSNPITNRR